MRTEGNAGNYVSGVGHRPLPAPDLSLRPPIQAETWTCVCGPKARRGVFHLCPGAPAEAGKKKRSAYVPPVELTEEEIVQRFSPATPVPEAPPIAGIPVKLDPALDPGVVELRNSEDETLARIVDPAKPRVRARVTASNPGPGVLIALSGALSTVEVTALLTDLLAALNKPPVAAPKIASRRTAPVAKRPAGAGRGAGGGPGNRGGTVTSRIEEVTRRYLDGETLKDLAAELGVSNNAVGQALKRRGVALRTSADTQRGQSRAGMRALTPEQIAEAVERYAAGDSMLQLARRYGVAESSIRRRLTAAGVEIRPTGRRRTSTASTA